MLTLIYIYRLVTRRCLGAGIKNVKLWRHRKNHYVKATLQCIIYFVNGVFIGLDNNKLKC